MTRTGSFGQKALAILLSLCMALVFLPGRVSAGTATSVSVGGETLDGTTTANAAGTAAFDAATGTLTLTNATILGNSIGIFATGDLHIVLVGTNTVTGANGKNDADGINVSGSLTISGDGSLTTTGGNGGNGVNSGNGGNGGDGIWVSGDFKIEAGTVTATGGNAGMGANSGKGGDGRDGIVALQSLSIETSTVTATGGAGGTGTSNGSTGMALSYATLRLGAAETVSVGDSAPGSAWDKTAALNTYIYTYLKVGAFPAATPTPAPTTSPDRTDPYAAYTPDPDAPSLGGTDGGTSGGTDTGDQNPNTGAYRWKISPARYKFFKNRSQHMPV